MAASVLGLLVSWFIHAAQHKNDVVGATAVRFYAFVDCNLQVDLAHGGNSKAATKVTVTLYATYLECIILL